MSSLSMTTNKLRIFLIPKPPNSNYLYTCPRGERIILSGLSRLSDVELVEKEEDADVNLLMYVPHDGNNKYDRTFVRQFTRNPLVVADWTDENNVELMDGALAYFKRSWVTSKREGNVFIRQPRTEWQDNYYPMWYTMLYEYPLVTPHYAKRPIDVGCYLRPDSTNRQAVLQFMHWLKHNNPLLNIQVGQVSTGSRSKGSDVYIDEQYFNMLGQTKILVTTEPSEWEGCSRLVEALCSRCAVLTDELMVPIHNKWEERKHLMYYPMNNLQVLADKIGLLINDPGIATQMSWGGFNHTVECINPEGLCRYIVSVINAKLGREPREELAIGN